MRTLTQDIVEVRDLDFRLAPSSQVEGLISLGESQGWRARVLGRAPLPTQPIFTGTWWLVPIEQEAGPIPVRAYERVQALYQAGIRPKGFVVAHEAPQLLPGPGQSREPRPRRRMRLPRLPALGGVAAAVAATLALAPAVVVAVAGLSLALSPLLLLGGLIAVDPCLVAVTEDGYWVEIDRWED